MTTNSTTAMGVEAIRERREGRYDFIADDFWEPALADIDYLLAANEQLRGELEASRQQTATAGENYMLTGEELTKEREYSNSLQKQLTEAKDRVEELIEGYADRARESVNELATCKQKTWAAAIEVVNKYGRGESILRRHEIIDALEDAQRKEK